MGSINYWKSPNLPPLQEICGLFISNRLKMTFCTSNDHLTKSSSAFCRSIGKKRQLRTPSSVTGESIQPTASEQQKHIKRTPWQFESINHQHLSNHVPSYRSVDEVVLNLWRSLSRHWSSIRRNIAWSSRKVPPIRHFSHGKLFQALITCWLQSAVIFDVSHPLDVNAQSTGESIDRPK